MHFVAFSAFHLIDSLGAFLAQTQPIPLSLSFGRFRTPTLLFDPAFRLGDILTFTGLLFTTLGLFFTWRQLRRNNISSRAQFMVSICDQYLTDRVTLRMMYDIEYERFTYTSDFHESRREQALDRLLGYFDKIAALHLMGCLSMRDLALVKYDLLQTYRNREVQKYLGFLDKITDVGGESGGGFERFRKVGKRMQQKTSRKKDGQATGLEAYLAARDEFFKSPTVSPELNPGGSSSPCL